LRVSRDAAESAGVQLPAGGGASVGRVVQGPAAVGRPALRDAVDAVPHRHAAGVRVVGRLQAEPPHHHLQAAEPRGRDGLRGVRRRRLLQQGANAQHRQVRPAHAHQERRGDHHQRQLPRHVAVPLGRQVGHRPGGGRERPVGHLRHRGQQRPPGGQPGEPVHAALRGHLGDHLRQEVGLQRLHGVRRPVRRALRLPGRRQRGGRRPRPVRLQHQPRARGARPHPLPQPLPVRLLRGLQPPGQP
ncbi:hypothetical protein CRUP_037234, partial [Coryphaenoides rupestris]